MSDSIVKMGTIGVVADGVVGVGAVGASLLLHAAATVRGNPIAIAINSRFMPGVDAIRKPHWKLGCARELRHLSGNCHIRCRHNALIEGAAAVMHQKTTLHVVRDSDVIAVAMLGATKNVDDVGSVDHE